MKKAFAIVASLCIWAAAIWNTPAFKQPSDENTTEDVDHFNPLNSLSNISDTNPIDPLGSLGNISDTSPIDPLKDIGDIDTTILRKVFHSIDLSDIKPINDVLSGTDNIPKEGFDLSDVDISNFKIPENGFKPD